MNSSILLGKRRPNRLSRTHGSRLPLRSACCAPSSANVMSHDRVPNVPMTSTYNDPDRPPAVAMDPAGSCRASHRGIAGASATRPATMSTCLSRGDHIGCGGTTLTNLRVTPVRFNMRLAAHTSHQNATSRPTPPAVVYAKDRPIHHCNPSTGLAGHPAKRRVLLFQAWLRQSSCRSRNLRHCVQRLRKHSLLGMCGSANS